MDVIRSHPVWVRGLKPMLGQRLYLLAGVAPRVGAWIETSGKRPGMTRARSHPVWVRGLKLDKIIDLLVVFLSHPVWVRGLKHKFGLLITHLSSSHPVWVRGLKHDIND